MQPDFFTQIRKAISHERLDAYQARSKADSELMLAAHYAQNIALSESLYPSLQAIEVCRAKALPLRVVFSTLPAVENAAPEEAIMVPTMVPPTAALMAAELPTCQKTFLAWAPFTRITL